MQLLTDRLIFTGLKHLVIKFKNLNVWLIHTLWLILSLQKKREAKSLVTGSDAYVLNRKKYNQQENGCACY